MKTTILYMFLYHLTSFSSADDCFTMVDSCPDTRDKWIERANENTCTSGKLYTCLMNINRTLVEACSYSRYIDPSRAGCPVFALCTIEDGALIDNNLKPCAEGVIGCPTSNHSGYYLTEMFKYPACLINSFEEKENRTGILLQSTSPVPFGRPDTKSAVNGALVSIIVIPLALVSFLAIVFVIIFRIRKSPDQNIEDIIDVENNINAEDDAMESQLKQTNGNKDMLETSSHDRFSEEEPRNVPGNPNDDIESFSREHNTQIESDLPEFRSLNKGNTKGPSNEDYPNQNMRTASKVLPLVDLDTRISDRKPCTTETDKLQSCAQASVDYTRRGCGKNKLSAGVHQPLLGDPNLDDLPKGDQIQISNSSIKLPGDHVISALPTRCTDSIQCTFKQTNENDDMLETKSGAAFSTAELPTRTGITYDENKKISREHNTLQESNSQRFQCLIGGRKKSSSDLDYQRRPIRPASHVLPSVDLNIGNSDLKKESEKLLPEKSSSQPIVVYSKKEEGKSKVLTDEHQPLLGDQSLGEIPKGEEVSNQIHMSSLSPTLPDDDMIDRSQAWSTDTIQSTLKQTNENDNMLGKKSGAEFSTAEPPTRTGITYDENRKITDEHQTLLGDPNLEEIPNGEKVSDQIQMSNSSDDKINRSPTWSTDSIQSTLKQTNENDDMLETKSGAEFSTAEPPTRIAISYDENKKITDEHQPLLGDPNLEDIPNGEEVSDHIQMSNSSIKLPDDDEINRSPTWSTYSIQSTLKQANENDDMLETKSGAEFSTAEPPTRVAISYDENKKITDEHQPLLGDPNLEEIPNGEEVSDHIQMSNSSIKLPDDDEINRSPTSSTYSIQSKLQQKNKRIEMLETPSGTKFSKGDSSHRLDISHDENKNLSHNAQEEFYRQDLRCVNEDNRKIRSDIDYPTQARRPASHVPLNDDLDTRPSCKMEKGKIPSTKPSAKPMIASSELPIDIEHSLQGRCNLGEISEEENVGNLVSLSSTSSADTSHAISIPSEIMDYLRATDFKKIFSSLNVTTMKLLTKAPQAIGHVGRLHFIANLTSFQIGADSQEGQNLRMHAFQFGEESNKCFLIAKNNILDIKCSLNVVIERLSTLSSIMSDECQESSSEGISIFIDSITAGINECTKRCDETEETFMRLLKRLQPFDNSFQRAKKKVDAVKSFDNEGGNNLTLSRFKSSLKNIRELIDETEDLFRELCNRWNNIKDFFRNMHSFFTTGLKNDIILYSKLSVIKIKSSNEDKSTMKKDKRDLRFKEDVLHKLQLKARYGQIVSEFYLFVSREFLADCLHQLSRSLYLEDQRDVAGMESSMQKLQKMCVVAETKVECLCDRIEQFINQ